MTGIFYVLLRQHGVERTPNKSQHTKLTLEKKILSPLLPGFELVTFRSRDRHSNQRVVPAVRTGKNPSGQQVIHFKPDNKFASSSQDFTCVSVLSLFLCLHSSSSLCVAIACLERFLYQIMPDLVR